MRLEGMYSERSLVPTDAVVAFIDYLLEDYADDELSDDEKSSSSSSNSDREEKFKSCEEDNLSAKDE